MKCCILAAGRGTRMGSDLPDTHKALLPLGNKAIISHIIDCFDQSCEFVVVLGSRKELVRDYLEIAHPERSIKFIEIENFAGPGSGPGLSLLSAKDELDEPFLFTACDTLIRGKLPTLDHNWMGVVEREDVENWCSVKTSFTGEVDEIYYKEPAETNLVFTGISFVHDVAEFWEGLGTNDTLLGKELQVNNGLESLVAKGLKVHCLDWIDTGSKENYLEARKFFEQNYTFDGKVSDATYRLDKRVVKYFPDPRVAKAKFLRGSSDKSRFAPVSMQQGSFFSYDFVEGQVLSKLINGSWCAKFLSWAENGFWQERKIPENLVGDACRRFYRDKTLSRLERFCTRFLPRGETMLSINGTPCETVSDLIDSIPDRFYSGGMASSFHGDLHDDNIIWTGDTFVLIDWREDFAGNRDWGDRYYDLAKFLHTLEFGVLEMESREWKVDSDGDELRIDHKLSFRKLEARDSFFSFVAEQGYNNDRVLLINALIFVNMAPLYDKEMSEYLYLLGRYMLQGVLSKAQF